MHPDLKRDWIAALRSGKFKQGTSSLNGPEGYCCLGVLCELLVEPLGLNRVQEGNKVRYDGTFATLPWSVEKFTGLDILGSLPSGVTYKNQAWNTLAGLNDAGMTFAEIADVIDQQF
jgi:hypothetical protein